MKAVHRQAITYLLYIHIFAHSTHDVTLVSVQFPYTSAHLCICLILRTTDNNWDYKSRQWCLSLLSRESTIRVHKLRLSTDCFAVFIYKRYSPQILSNYLKKVLTTHLTVIYCTSSRGSTQDEHPQEEKGTIHSIALE